MDRAGAGTKWGARQLNAVNLLSHAPMTHPTHTPEPMTLRRVLAYSLPSALLLAAAVPAALALRHLRTALDRSFTLSLDGLSSDADDWLRELEAR